ncbi:protein-L-isoaspartate(D-aspartate) O-methyltransferase [Candidatus Woesearchaeota archaeon]|nr:protein-L-isoaspartate(D-aspartate) O-methyltransferase [Candidatus Woesearchaeota archaeon]
MDMKSQLLGFWKAHFHFREEELAAFTAVKREDFIPRELLPAAYQDTPLPLLRGKTISQPTTVMLMISALQLQPGERVFEIGTGSGYHAALISRLVQPGSVITTEVIPELVQFARGNLNKAGIQNVSVHEEDGSKGMPSEAPFDKIIITAACREFPRELLAQLKDNGMIIGPVGNAEEQEMVLGIKEQGALRLQFLGQFLFTPMHGKYGFEA